MLEPREWEERWVGKGNSGLEKDLAFLTAEERELQGVKRAEEEERYGTGGRDLMGGGGSGGSALKMRMDEDTKSALMELRSGEGGRAVQLVSLRLSLGVYNRFLLTSTAT